MYDAAFIYTHGIFLIIPLLFRHKINNYASKFNRRFCNFLHSDKFLAITWRSPCSFLGNVLEVAFYF